MDYWADTIAEAFEDAGISASDQQIKTVAGWAESAHENYSTFYGLDVANKNFSANRENEIQKLKDQLKAEKEKVHCEVCGGRGNTREPCGPSHVAISTCWKCNGEGRHKL